MKFGFCSGISKERLELSKKLLAIGYDYIEACAGNVWAMTDEELDEIAAENLPILTANGMFPIYYPDTEERIRVVGPEKKEEWCKEYYKEVMRKCAKLGIQTVVFGSGGQRRIPEGMDIEEGLAQYRKVCTDIAEIAAGYGITIVVEPLNYTETNSINTVKEGFEQVKKMNTENVKLLMDIYHVQKNGEDTDYAPALYNELRLIHWSNPVTRKVPKEITEEQLYYAKLLKDNGYDGFISVEAGLPEDDEHAKASIAVLKELFK